MRGKLLHWGTCLVAKIVIFDEEEEDGEEEEEGVGRRGLTYL